MRFSCLVSLLLVLGCSPSDEVSRESIGKIISVEYTDAGFNALETTIVKSEGAVIRIDGSKSVLLGVEAYRVKFSNGSYYITWDNNDKFYLCK